MHLNSSSACCFLVKFLSGRCFELAFGRPCWSHFQWHCEPRQERRSSHRTSDLRQAPLQCERLWAQPRGSKDVLQTQVVAALCCWCSPRSSMPSRRWDEHYAAYPPMTEALLQLEPMDGVWRCCQCCWPFGGRDRCIVQLATSDLSWLKGKRSLELSPWPLQHPFLQASDFEVLLKVAKITCPLRWFTRGFCQDMAAAVVLSCPTSTYKLGVQQPGPNWYYVSKGAARLRKLKDLCKHALVWSSDRWFSTGKSVKHEERPDIVQSN